MAGGVGGEGGLHGVYPPRSWGYPLGATEHSTACAPRASQNCFQTAQTGGGRVETRRKGLGFEWGDCVCWTTRSPGREADVDPPKRVCNRGISDPASSSARTPPPSLELCWGGETKVWNHISLHSWEDTTLAWTGKIALYFFFSFFSLLFLFLEGERPVIVLNTCSFLQPPATESPPFLHLSFSFPLSLLKVREWRRPISARLPFCEFNSEASPAFAWICLQTPRSLSSGCRGEAAASPGLLGGVFHIGALFGGL